VRIARHYQVSDFFIGAAILAVGSDLPELVVSFDAALRQLSGQNTANLIVGNALGSLFGQFGLVMGLAGLIGHLAMTRLQVLRHGGVLIGATLALFLVSLDGVVNRYEGIGLIAAFIAYMIFLFGEERLVLMSRKTRDSGVLQIWLRLALGLGVVAVSAELIVRTAMALAEQWQVDQSFIGIAIIGVGTSLPELIISVAAIIRARVGLSLGNLVGSNIRDTLLPIGIAAAVVPIGFARSLLVFDLPVLLALTCLALLFLYLRWGIQRPQALCLILCYFAYLYSKVQLVS